MTQPDHNGLYGLFFSDPRIVAQLVREFVAGPWPTISTSTAWSA